MTEEKQHKHIFGANEVAELTKQEIEHRRDQNKIAGIETGLATLALDLLPWRPGDLVGILGLSGNGKSLLMRSIMAHNAAKFQKEGAHRYGIYGSYEQSVEQQGMQDFAELSGVSPKKMHMGEIDESDWKLMMGAHVKRSQVPVAIIGHSTRHQAKIRRGRPMPTSEEFENAAIRFVEEQEKKPALIAIDYLTKIPLSQEWRRAIAQGHVENINWAKDLAIKLECPVMLGAQAQANVQDRKWPVPMMYDAHWGKTEFANACDAMLSVWMPKNDIALGEELPTHRTGGKIIEVTERLIVITICKQKWGSFPVTVFCEVSEDYATVKQLHMDSVDVSNL